MERKTYSESSLLEYYENLPETEKVEILIAAMDNMKSYSRRSKEVCICLALGYRPNPLEDNTWEGPPLPNELPVEFSYSRSEIVSYFDSLHQDLREKMLRLAFRQVSGLTEDVICVALGYTKGDNRKWVGKSLENIFPNKATADELSDHFLDMGYKESANVLQNIVDELLEDRSLGFRNRIFAKHMGYVPLTEKLDFWIKKEEV